MFLTPSIGDADGVSGKARYESMRRGRFKRALIFSVFFMADSRNR
jgi:hypothetical protein